MTKNATRPDDRPIIVPQDNSPDNRIQPFQIEGMDVRGRAVRLGTALHEILASHDYPDPVGQLLGELVTLTALFGSFLKEDGRVTVQAKAQEGAALNFIVADYCSPGHLRGYADFDEEAVAALGENADFRSLIGAGGTMAITLEQGADNERYQGIVDLSGDDLGACAITYFQTSEQTPTALRLASSCDRVSGHWRAGGIMVQHLARREEGGPRLLSGDERENWRRASILMQSVKAEELLDADLTLDALLYRLFHEDGVRVFDPQSVVHQCRCSQERLKSVLTQFTEEDRAHMLKDGKVEAVCQFCNRTYKFSPEELDIKGDS